MNLHLENLPRTISLDCTANAANVTGGEIANVAREEGAGTVCAEAADVACGGGMLGDAGAEAGALAVPQVVMIDQRALPSELVEIRTSDWRQVVDAVKTLAVRGAPAIGVAGAAAVMLAAYELAERGLPSREGLSVQPGASTGRESGDVSARDAVSGRGGDEGGPRGRESGDVAARGANRGRSMLTAASPALFAVRLREAARVIAEARPTAVNLSWGVERALQVVSEALKAGKTPWQAAEALRGLTGALIAEDEAANRAIGAHGAALLAPIAAAKGRPLNILTHCNAGSLATAFYGTALGVVYAAAEQGLVERVYADETRPVGQGARLTVWELAQAGVPTTLICDNMAASLMAAGRIDAVVVGADRIAANGDAANKIGTLGVAVLAHHFGVPFYVAAPESTRDDACVTGAAIPIEERAAAEVLAHPIEGVEVFNPAFDVTPAALISAIITEKGIWHPGS